MLDKHVCNLCDWLNNQLRRLFKPLLAPPREGDRLLDISACTDEQKKDILSWKSPVQSSAGVMMRGVIDGV
jgi:hypothetical protein